MPYSASLTDLLNAYPFEKCDDPALLSGEHGILDNLLSLKHKALPPLVFAIPEGITSAGQAGLLLLFYRNGQRPFPQPVQIAFLLGNKGNFS